MTDHDAQSHIAPYRRAEEVQPKRWRQPMGQPGARSETTRRWWQILYSAVLVAVGGLGIVVGTALGDDPAPPTCQFEGRSYSLGSLILIRGSSARECLPDKHYGGARWHNVRVD